MYLEMSFVASGGFAAIYATIHGSYVPDIETGQYWVRESFFASLFTLSLTLIGFVVFVILLEQANQRSWHEKYYVLGVLAVEGMIQTLFCTVLLLHIGLVCQVFLSQERSVWAMTSRRVVLSLS